MPSIYKCDICGALIENNFRVCFLEFKTINPETNYVEGMCRDCFNEVKRLIASLKVKKQKSGKI